MVTVVSETKQIFDGNAYYLCGKYFQRDGKRLHREIWERLYGPIPKGFHVHHRDGNRANNDPSNLELLSEFEHLSGHSSTPEAKERARAAIEIARPYAAEWHKSEEGRRMASIWAKEGAKKVKPVDFVCEQCGKPFSSKARHSRFCSNACRAANRRTARKDYVIKICPVCGGEFEVSKYEDTKCCSRKCAWQLRKERTACGTC